MNNKGIETVGSSYCTWKDATRFVDGWDSDYSLFLNNCQHFTEALEYFLENTGCNRPPSSRSKQDYDTELDQQIQAILSNCSIVCCYDDIGSGDNNSSAALLFPSIALLLLSCIFGAATIMF